MARKISNNNRHLAKLVTGERVPCAFCLREVDDEVTYGKLYAIGDIQCHYFCCLLSCCLIQKGSDEEGLFGFMYSDILVEIERCKKHKCSYCGQSGANLGCSVGACRKQFHVPCGRDKNAVSLYYGSYKSFCQQHAPKQKIPEHIMAKAQIRKKVYRNKDNHNISVVQSPESDGMEEMLCLICYEPVEGFPSVNTFWPPCCGKDAWFHRSCLQRMALSAGMHYLKCPLCNDKENFYNAVVEQGYYVPDRDAAWELEQNAFAEIYERAVTCSAEPCICPMGRAHDAENGKWDIKLCLLCGSAGEHAECILQSQPSMPEKLDQSENTTDKTEICILQSQPSKPDELDQSENATDKTEISSVENVLGDDALCMALSKLSPSEPKSSIEANLSQSEQNDDLSEKMFTSIRFVCKSCLPAAPEDLNALASSIEAIIQEEQAQSAAEARRPVMPSRMSIRRTKRPPLHNRPSTSRSVRADVNNGSSASPNTVSSRLELNLKPPRRVPADGIVRSGAGETKLMSPIKLLEQSFKEKMVCTGVRDAVLDDAVVDTLRLKFRKPRPMCERKRIIDNILDRIFDDLMNNPKQKEQIKEWCSPKKCISEDSKELKYIPNDTLKQLEESQNKENNSNTFNTLLKDPNYIKIGDINNILINDEYIENNAVNFENSNNLKISDSNQNDGKTEVTPKEEPNDLSKNDENVSDVKIEDISNYNEESNKRCTLTRNSVKSFTIDNIKDVKENSVSNEISDQNEIAFRKKSEVIDQKNSEVIIIKNSENKNFETDTSKNFDTNTPNEESINTEDKFNNKNEFPKKHVTLRINIGKGRRSLKGVEKSKRTNNSSKDKQKMRSKSESSTDINILKRLLTEKDLCSQLLRELTTGNTDKNTTNEENNSNAALKSVYNTSNSQHETENGNKMSEKINETQKCDIRKAQNKTSKSLRTIKKSIDSLNSQKELRRRISTPKDSKETKDFNEAAKSSTQNATLSNESIEIQETSKTFQTPIVTESPENLNVTSELIEIPKHKTIDIQQDSSLEISENDQHINIDVIKIEDSPTTEDSYKSLKVKLPDKSKTCLKFSPTEEILEKTDVGIDLESFKKEYLSEVDRQFQCNFRHKHVGENLNKHRRFHSPIDFALDAVRKKENELNTKIQKRKLSECGIQLPPDNNFSKRRKTSESDLTLLYDYDKNIPNNSIDIKEEVENDGYKKMSDNENGKNKPKTKERRKKKKNKRKSNGAKNIKVTIDSSEKRNKNNKIKTKFAIRNENIKVRIEWKKKQLRLNIKSKKEAKEEKKIKDNHSKFKQYILQFSEGSSKEVLVKPEKDVCPLKRMYVKKEKSPDKLKQMSIQNFFRLK